MRMSLEKLKQIQKGFGVSLLFFSFAQIQSNNQNWIYIPMAVFFILYCTLFFIVLKKENMTIKDFLRINRLKVIIFSLFLIAGFIVPLYFLYKI